ncbi:MAG: 6-phosphofructokinase, partial [Clostridia bacterium]|nr:6-phosphofructokinase [Clostridia bacterium]
YSITIGCADISKIANAIKHVPREFINERSNGVTRECLDYLIPLIQGEMEIHYENGMPRHAII